MAEQEIDDRSLEGAATGAIVPFGKYRHWALRHVPADYLKWLMQRPDLEQRWPAFEKQLRREWARRMTAHRSGPYQP